MKQGVYIAYRKDKTPYYRASIHFKNKHVTLGSYDTEDIAHAAYIEAQKLYYDCSITIDNYRDKYEILNHDRVITILNHRDNLIYIKRILRQLIKAIFPNIILQKFNHIVHNSYLRFIIHVSFSGLCVL